MTSRTWASTSTSGVPLASLMSKSTWLELLVVAVGCAAALLPADHPLLLEQRGAVPGLDAISNAPRHQVGAAGQPVRTVALGHPDVLVQGVGVLGLEVVGSVLEPEHVSGRRLFARRRRRPAEAQLRILHRDGAEPDAGQVADRVHRDLRVVRARLHADVAAALGGVEDLVGELRQIGQRGWALVGDTEPVLAVLLEERRPEPDRQCQLRRGQAQRLTGIVRRRVGIAADRPVGHRLLAARHPLGHLGPLLQQSDDVVAIVRRDVERAEVHPVLLRRDDAGLALAAERRPVGAGRPGRCWPPTPGRRARPRPPRRRPRRLPPPHRTACAATARRAADPGSAAGVSGSLWER